MVSITGSIFDLQSSDGSYTFERNYVGDEGMSSLCHRERRLQRNFPTLPFPGCQKDLRPHGLVMGYSLLGHAANPTLRSTPVSSIS